MKNWTVLVLKAMVLGKLFLSFFKTHPYTDPCLKVRDHNFVGFGSNHAMLRKSKSGSVCWTDQLQVACNISLMKCAGLTND